MSGPAVPSRRVTPRTTRRARARMGVALFAFCAVIVPGAPRASAAPTLWARARQPDLDRRVSVMSQVESLLLKYRRTGDPEIGERFPGMGEIYLREARKLLEAAGAETSRDPMLRYRLAEVLHELKQPAKAAKMYETVVRSPSLPAALRATGLFELAICYARVGRHEDEIKAYGEALTLETRGSARATIQANRAEAYMALGDITSALAGYRAALASLLAIEMFRFGVTTLWGLAVALDRSGDLETSLGSINLARAYDPADRLINGPGWFYATPYDDAWYAALGHWARARQATLGAARAEEYARAVAAWEDYIERASADDRWVPLAKARLAACEKERDRKRDGERDAAPKRSRSSPGPGSSPARSAPSSGTKR